MYADHDSAPSSIIASPWMDAAASISNSPPVVADVDIRNNPNKAKPHPPQTDDLMLSPAKAEISGVNTTLVWVRKDARAAGLKRRPAVIRPFACHNIVCHLWIKTLVNESVMLSENELKERINPRSTSIRYTLSNSPAHQSSKMPTPKHSSTLVEPSPLPHHYLLPASLIHPNIAHSLPPPISSLYYSHPS